MTITGALNNAMTGLRAAGLATQVVSSNLSNALTPGYGKRVLSLSASSIGNNGGVAINGTIRDVNPALIADRQSASADYNYQSARTEFLTSLENSLGTPDEETSINARLAAFESDLITAASRPDAPDRLAGAVNSARDLATSISGASADIQDQRSRADLSISEQVDRLNAALHEMEELNGRITATRSQGADDAALRDYRQSLVDEISEMVSVRTVPRDNGAIALYTTGGAIILDGRAAEIEFEPVNLVTANMSVDAGTLSGLKINGYDVRVGTGNNALGGGSIAAQFEIRDELGPEAQAQLDAVARDLIERFEDPSVDPSLGGTLPALFTDDGARLDPLDEVGLAGRLTLNALVDPQEGGETWRLRDGLGASAPGDVGDASLLQSLGGALATTRTPSSGSFGVGLYDISDLTSSMMSQITTDRTHADQQLSFSASQLNELQAQELAQGVDSDAELSRLILIEQAYAANARIIQTVDELMQTLLGI